MVFDSVDMIDDKDDDSYINTKCFLPNDLIVYIIITT